MVYTDYGVFFIPYTRACIVVARAVHFKVFPRLAVHHIVTTYKVSSSLLLRINRKHNQKRESIMHVRSPAIRVFLGNRRAKRREIHYGDWCFRFLS